MMKVTSVCDVYMYLYTYVCVCVYMYMYVCMYVCMYVFVCMYVCMYVSIYLYFLFIDSLSIWFRAIAKGEPCDTYVKTASTDLARTCEAIESHHLNSDGDDALCVQNLQSIADYIRGAKVCRCM